MVAKPSRRGCQARVMFPFLFSWLWHPRGLLCRGGSKWDQDPPLGRAMALTPTLNRVPFSGGFTLGVQGIAGPLALLQGISEKEEGGMASGDS